MNPGEIAIDGGLVRYLRRGVKRELGANLAILQVEVDTCLDPRIWREALARFDDARAMFELIGIADDPEQPDLSLDLGRWPRLTLRVLESEHRAEVMRLEDARHEGFDLPARDVPVLGELIAEIRKKTGTSRRHRHNESVLARQFARRRTRRPRGDR
jgi:hypothetical protein